MCVEKILLVDDDSALCKAMKRQFERHGYKVEIVGNGKEALKALEGGDFDLIISDLGMPEMNGLELLKELNRKGHRPPFICLTANSEMKSHVDMMNNHAFAYLAKPIKSDDLLNAVRQAIDRQEISEAGPGED